MLKNNIYIQQIAIQDTSTTSQFNLDRAIDYKKERSLSRNLRKIYHYSTVIFWDSTKNKLTDKTIRINKYYTIGNSGGRHY